MGRHDRIAATIIVSMLAVLWLGFLVHRAPFFAGSLWGGVFGVVGAAFLLVPLVYTVVKRSATLRRAFTRERPGSPLPVSACPPAGDHGFTRSKRQAIGLGEGRRDRFLPPRDDKHVPHAQCRLAKPAFNAPALR